METTELENNMDSTERVHNHAGEIKEFNSPYSLFSKTDSIFGGLCDKAKIKAQDFRNVALQSIKEGCIYFFNSNRNQPILFQNFL